MIICPYVATTTEEEEPGNERIEFVVFDMVEHQIEWPRSKNSGI
jgi:hypothetical protein